ncbi:MAG: post-PEP-CTERM-1 domain-containing protein [Thermoanaerobaculia bacterium]
MESAEEPLPAGKGLRAFIDPKTGQLRQPTAEETAAFAATSRVARNKSIEGLEVEYRKDGSKFVDLQGRFMHSLRVTRTADGTSSFTCTDRDPHTHSQPDQPAASVAPATK